MFSRLLSFADFILNFVTRIVPIWIMFVTATIFFNSSSVSGMRVASGRNPGLITCFAPLENFQDWLSWIGL